ncbi:M23 family metallopeptidase [Microbacterium mangrovi]|uniref:M23 family metallopeptidase n=1 Tax=Microbacterium mangrovi TaxID=1348253 RepID=UPI000B17C226|nr:M23 family metallopeptidase [Microbacterium mangrovi]
MGKYTLPSATVASSWLGHRHRTPPSREPGTDFAVAFGTVVVAPFAGVVRSIHTGTDGAAGRFVGIELADRNFFRALHLSSISVTVGQHVTQGHEIGRSGASGFGSDHHYGPHVHESLWVGTDPITAGFAATTDIVAFSAQHGGGAKPASAPHLKPTQRRAKALVNRRAKPTALSTLLPGPLPKGTIGNFVGFRHGQKVEGNDVWFKGISGNWFWSGGFEGGANTAGLKPV